MWQARPRRDPASLFASEDQCLWFTVLSTGQERYSESGISTLIFIFRILGYYMGYLHSTALFGAGLCSREENIITDPRVGVFACLDGTYTKSWIGFLLKKGGGVQ